MTRPETALVILVPEAEALVKPFRDLYDPSAAAGVPAHVTLLYPFKPPAELADSVIEGLRQCFAGVPGFDFSLTSLRRFPGTLYLAPEPAEPFRQLTQAIWKRHPETPPYGGRHSDSVPHLSLADRLDAASLDLIEREFAEIARGRLPIRSRASTVAFWIISLAAGRRD